MLNKTKVITTISLDEYGTIKGRYTIDVPIVDFNAVEILDYKELDVLLGGYFNWIDEAVLKLFDENIYYKTDDDTSYETDEDILYETDDENSIVEIKLEEYLQQIPSNINHLINYMLFTKNHVKYKFIICLDDLENNERFDIFKEWFSKDLLFQLKYNVIDGEVNGFKKRVTNEIEDVIGYLMSNEEYELAFNILISLMYAYRLIFALIKHNDVMYDYIAEELFNIWDSIENIFMFNVKNKKFLDEAVDKIEEYLLIFQYSGGLSILDSKMCLNVLVQNSKAGSEIIKNFSMIPFNQMSKRYVDIIRYVAAENDPEKRADEVYKLLDETSKIILSDIYETYDKYESVIKIMEDVRSNTRNKQVLKLALNNLSIMYEELNMTDKLQDIYYQKLENGDETAFSYIYDNIVSHSNLNKNEELEKLLLKAKEKLSKSDYFKCLMGCELYDNCIEILKESKDVLLLYRICNILITEIQDYEYNTIETNEFLKAALETLGKNQKAMHSEKIRAILESNTW